MLLEELFPFDGELLTEALRVEVNKDVDNIYNMFFKQALTDIHKGMFHHLSPMKIDASSSRIKRIFVTDFLRDVFEKNPISVFINDDGNYYNTIKKELHFGINDQAITFLRSMGTWKNAKFANPVTFNKLKTDLSPQRIKQSIHHELAHYIDDTLNNRHLSKTVQKASDVVDSGVPFRSQRVQGIIRRGQADVYMTDYEMEALIHNIYQVKRYYEKRWDRMTFDDMISKSTSLESLADDYKNRGLYNDFKRKLVTRMSREGLLGKMMR